MPALPKRKPSTRRQGKRRATHRIKSPTLVPCSYCGKLKRPHQVCLQCGHYQKKTVFEVKTKEKKKKQD